MKSIQAWQKPHSCTAHYKDALGCIRFCCAHVCQQLRITHDMDGVKQHREYCAEKNFPEHNQWRSPLWHLEGFPRSSQSGRMFSWADNSYMPLISLCFKCGFLLWISMFSHSIVNKGMREGKRRNCLLHFGNQTMKISYSLVSLVFTFPFLKDVIL
jgi:hypothetical protein